MDEQMRQREDAIYKTAAIDASSLISRTMVDLVRCGTTMGTEVSEEQELSCGNKDCHREEEDEEEEEEEEEDIKEKKEKKKNVDQNDDDKMEKPEINEQIVEKKKIDAEYIDSVKANEHIRIEGENNCEYDSMDQNDVSFRDEGIDKDDEAKLDKEIKEGNYDSFNSNECKLDSDDASDKLVGKVENELPIISKGMHAITSLISADATGTASKGCDSLAKSSDSLSKVNDSSSKVNDSPSEMVEPLSIISDSSNKGCVDEPAMFGNGSTIQLRDDNNKEDGGGGDEKDYKEDIDMDNTTKQSDHYLSSILSLLKSGIIVKLSLASTDVQVIYLFT